MLFFFYIVWFLFGVKDKSKILFLLIEDILQSLYNTIAISEAEVIKEKVKPSPVKKGLIYCSICKKETKIMLNKLFSPQNNFTIFSFQRLKLKRASEKKGKSCLCFECVIFLFLC